MANSSALKHGLNCRIDLNYLDPSFIHIYSKIYRSKNGKHRPFVAEKIEASIQVSMF